MRVEIDNLELPILDGSARPFAELLAQAGVKRQRRKRRYMRILKRVAVRDGDKRISIEPGEAFEVVCETLYPHPLVGAQRLEMAVTPAAYLAAIAPARTFGFERDLDALRDLGLIRGATLDSAVCFTERGVLNEGGLRFPDEPCRHKLLDLVGDLALLGHARDRTSRCRARGARHARCDGGPDHERPWELRDRNAKLDPILSTPDRPKLGWSGRPG